MAQIIGIDVGGTFTDLLFIDESGTLRSHKILNRTAGAMSAVLGATELLDETTDLDAIVHGTTIATNTVIERDGARTLLVTTRGFRDILDFQKQERRDIWNFRWRRPEPLVPRKDRVEVEERISATGSVVQQLDAAQEVERLSGFLDFTEYESVAVCLLNSYRNGKHEQELGVELSKRHPHLYVTLSSALVPQYREYDRMSTTVLNAYLGPVVRRHLERLEVGFSEQGLEVPLMVMQSDGTVVPKSVASERAAAMCLSGPSGGILAAQQVAGHAGVKNVICLDMGGTSTDVAVIHEGESEIRHDADIDGLPNLVPTFRIETVGAGGGSIIHLDEANHLHCGPQSAGADPGPACYKNGGQSFTVTDAWVILGVIRELNKSDSVLEINEAAARRSAEPLAKRLNVSVEELATYAVSITSANMSRALRLVTVEQGHDPRDFTMVCYGGAGGLHAVACAEELGVRSIIVPVAAGMFSAYGLACADIARSYVRSLIQPLTGSEADVEQSLTDMQSEAESDLEIIGQGHSLGYFFAMDLRYSGQAHDVTIEFLTQDSFQEVANRFHKYHETRYGFSEPETSVELVNVRLQARIATDTPRLMDSTCVDEKLELVHTPWEPTAPVGFMARNGLVFDRSYSGPLVIEEPTSTIVVPEAWTARRDVEGQLWLEKK